MEHPFHSSSKRVKAHGKCRSGTARLPRRIALASILIIPSRPASGGTKPHDRSHGRGVTPICATALAIAPDRHDSPLIKQLSSASLIATCPTTPGAKLRQPSASAGAHHAPSTRTQRGPGWKENRRPPPPEQHEIAIRGHHTANSCECARLEATTSAAYAQSPCAAQLTPSLAHALLEHRPEQRRISAGNGY